MASEAVSMGNHNYGHQMIAVERGNILALEEQGGGDLLEVRQKGYLKVKDDNLKSTERRNTNLRKILG